MDSVESKEKLTALIQRRDRVKENVQRIQGRLDIARSDLAASEEDCRKHKVDPNKIDEVIAQLTSRFNAETAALTNKIEAAEAKVAPFLKEETT